MFKAARPVPAPMPPEPVLLLHGLGRLAASMRPLARALRRAGFRPVNVDYPSRRAPIDRLADDIVGAHAEAVLAEGAARVHFVTHSLGGVLVRHWAARHPLPEGSRAVMIAPPHAGSEVADWVSRLAPARWWCGPVLSQLVTGEGGIPGALGPVGLETGVIAGDRSHYPFYGRLFEGAHDGLVAVERAKVEGMADFAVVPRGHTFIMRAPEVIAQTLHFLQYGRFVHDEPPSSPQR